MFFLKKEKKKIITDFHSSIHDRITGTRFTLLFEQTNTPHQIYEQHFSRCQAIKGRSGCQAIKGRSLRDGKEMISKITTASFLDSFQANAHEGKA